jgi:hypothetical protein
MRKTNAKILNRFLFSLLLLITNQEIHALSIVTNSQGVGISESLAIDQAKKNAIQNACGEIFLSNSRSQTDSVKNTTINNTGESSKTFNNNIKSADDNQSLVGGSIKSFKILRKKTENNTTLIEIEAIVSECSKPEELQNNINSNALLQELKKISTDIKKLSDSGGLVGNPKTYAEIYHNARILSQRGEADQALRFYEQLFNFPIQMFDPISDVITLSRRIYGLKGARNYLDKTLKSKMKKASYYSAQLLTIDTGNEVNFEFTDIATTQDLIDASKDFPPLAYQILMLKKPYQLDWRDLSWSKWSFYFKLNKTLQAAVENGSILSYYVDQIRGGELIESYSREKIALAFDDLFLFALPNSGMPNSEYEIDKLRKMDSSDILISEFRYVDFERSPVIIDYTYYFDKPPVLSPYGFHTNYFSWMFDSINPKREEGLLRLSVWDSFIDNSKPFKICAIKDKIKEECIDLNSDRYTKCKFRGMSATSERYKCFVSQGEVRNTNFLSLPNADVTFSSKEWLGSSCLSKVSYYDGTGNFIQIDSKDIVATNRWSKNHKSNGDIDSLILQCGYNNQTKRVAPKGAKPFKNSL